MSGVSGAELIGALLNVEFEDGSMAAGHLHGDNNQASAQGLASQASPVRAARLTVNRLAAGEAGTYIAGGPHVLIDGPVGQTARVVLAKGIIRPYHNLYLEPYATKLDAQLGAWAATEFPANNAAQFQTVDVLFYGTPQDITDLFDYTSVRRFDLAVEEDKLPLAFVVGIIDPFDNGLPLGPVATPIYLQYSYRTADTRWVAIDDLTDEVFSYTTSDIWLAGEPFALSYDRSRGVVAAELRNEVWVVDADKPIHIYDCEGDLLHPWQFSSFSAPSGSAVHGNDLWIVSNQFDEVHTFAGGASSVGRIQTPSASFALNAFNDGPQGLTTDGTSIWVVNDATNAWKVFKYSMAGDYLGC